MILLSRVIETFGRDLLSQYSQRLLPGHRRALAAMGSCRTDASPTMLAHCPACEGDVLLPHSCGHRSCPHCQHYESQRWLERQQQKRLPVDYFMITFTLPAQLRDLAWRNQSIVYSLLFQISWETLKSFGLRDKTLQGQLGATGVLHTHSRALDFHPHVHMIVPAGALDTGKRLWRKKRGKYLFKQKNLARVFRGKWLQALSDHDLPIPAGLPKQWVVDCRHVGRGKHALAYLGKYLYRGVLREKDIIAVADGKVTFRYVQNDGSVKTRTLAGADFLWLLLQHVLPKGFRRARDFGFLHANSKTMIRLLQLLLHVVLQSPSPKPRTAIICPHCGAAMHIVATRLRAQTARSGSP